MAIYDGSQVVVYILDEPGYHIHRQLECESYDPTIPLSYLYFCKIPATTTTTTTSDTENDNGSSSSSTTATKTTTTYLLIGISSSGKHSFIWKLHYSDNDTTKELKEITFCQSQRFDEQWKKEPNVIELSGCFGTSTTSTLLESLKYYNNNTTQAATTTTTKSEKEKTTVIAAVDLAVVIDQEVICYKLFQTDQGGFEWQETFIVKTNLQQIQQIKYTANIMAIGKKKKKKKEKKRKKKQ